MNRHHLSDELDRVISEAVDWVCGDLQQLTKDPVIIAAFARANVDKIVNYAAYAAKEGALIRIIEGACAAESGACAEIAATPVLGRRKPKTPLSERGPE
jgi:hypothetical protein